ncbi:MAG: hypothetical protein HY814_07700 [Candidatus Riflebacteria bacterium]|nr:hypothetical protein [Candidatus Riflebacteria bacterium]
MMVDTNILAQAVSRASTSQQTADRFLTRLIDGQKTWHLTWPILYDFVRTVSDPNVFYEPLRPDEIRKFLDRLLACSSLRILLETEKHAQVFLDLLKKNPDLPPDEFKRLHTVAVMTEHGVTELAVGAGDYSRFPQLVVRRPLSK